MSGIGLLLAQDPANYSLIFVMIMIGLMFYFLIIRPQQKRDRNREDELKSLKKNDRIVTAGGIYGTVVNVQKDEIVIRVDENTNTKLRISRGSLSRIIRDGDTAAKE